MANRSEPRRRSRGDDAPKRKSANSRVKNSASFAKTNRRTVRVNSSTPKAPRVAVENPQLTEKVGENFPSDPFRKSEIISGEGGKTENRSSRRPKRSVDYRGVNNLSTNNSNVNNLTANNLSANNLSANSNVNNLTANYLSPDSQGWFRRAVVLLLTGALIFGAGLAIGKREGSSVVDTAINQIVKNGATDIERGILERAAIEGALKASGDQWANYFPKSALDAFNERQDSVFTGIGVSLQKTRSGVIEISGVEAKSPAANSGLRTGDELLEINGTRVQGASLTSVIALIRGEVGKRFDILVGRDDTQILATLRSTQLKLTNVEATQIAPRVGYLQIASFATGTASQVRKALTTLKTQDGVIIDLRNNPGGLLQEAVAVAEIFIGRGVIVSYRVNGSDNVFSASNPSPNSSPVVLMINRSTASAAEILAGAMQDRNRGVVIGERSYGKGSVQEFVTLGDGSKLELTVALYLTPSGRTIEGEGISPDLRVGNDELGLKALQILGGLASLNGDKGNDKGANLNKSEKN